MLLKSLAVSALVALSGAVDTSAPDYELINRAQSIVAQLSRNGTAPMYGELTKRQSRFQTMWLEQVMVHYATGHTLTESVKQSLAQFINSYSDDRLTMKHCPNGVCEVPFFLEPIWGYGCWCHFGPDAEEEAAGEDVPDLSQGRGRPQNRFDQICKDFNRCLRCAVLDGRTDGYNCRVEDKEYESAGGPTFISGCTVSNPNDECGAHVCSCEQTLIAEIMEIIFVSPEVVYTPEFLHDEPYNWDYVNECPPPSGPALEPVCCGKYPKRFPYGADSLNKACCADNVIYNPNYQACCDDGIARTIGECVPTLE